MIIDFEEIEKLSLSDLKFLEENDDLVFEMINDLTRHLKPEEEVGKYASIIKSELQRQITLRFERCFTF